MTEWCLNYDTGDYDYIDEDGFDYDKNEFVYNYDTSVFEDNDIFEDDNEDD